MRFLVVVGSSLHFVWQVASLYLRFHFNADGMNLVVANAAHNFIYQVSLVTAHRIDVIQWTMWIECAKCQRELTADWKKKWRTRHSISVSVHLLTPPTANKCINLCKSFQHWFASNKWRWSANMQTISWLVFSLFLRFFGFRLIIIVGICFAFYWYLSRNCFVYHDAKYIILIAF